MAMNRAWAARVVTRRRGSTPPSRPSDSLREKGMQHGRAWPAPARQIGEMLYTPTSNSPNPSPDTFSGMFPPRDVRRDDSLQVDSLKHVASNAGHSSCLQSFSMAM